MEQKNTTSNAGNKENADNHEDPLLYLSKPAGCVISAITLHAEFISTTLLLPLSSPFFSLFFHARATPARVARSAAAALHGLRLGFLRAACAVTSLVVIMALAFLLGIFVVRIWVEEPVFVRRPLHFDYTRPLPDAAAVVGGVVPKGQRVSVSLKLVVPESDFNRHVGIFQVSTEVISSNGHIIAASSRPCMLRFSSLPIRLMKIFAMAIPVLMGLHSETQQMVFEIVRYNEGTQKTESINVRLAPRAGTFDLPQLYDAEILLHTRLPRYKQVVYNWKWTLYVWVSSNIYVLLLIIMFCRFNTFDLLRRRRDKSHGFAGNMKDLEEFADALMRWRERSRRSKMMAQNQVAITSSDFFEDTDSSDAGDDSVSTEVISSNGHIIAASSRPCMLRFSSLPIRLMKIFAMAIPVLMGLHSETQQMVFDIVMYNEGTQKTESINVRLAPRAGTFDLPQLYDAEILLHTRLPRYKQVVYNWKWTLYVWISSNIYVSLLIIMFCRFNTFDLLRRRRDKSHAFAGNMKDSEEFADALKRWRERSRRSKMIAQNQVAITSSDFFEDTDSSDAGDDSASFVTSESLVSVVV